MADSTWGKIDQFQVVCYCGSRSVVPTLAGISQWKTQWQGAWQCGSESPAAAIGRTCVKSRNNKVSVDLAHTHTHTHTHTYTHTHTNTHKHTHTHTHTNTHIHTHTHAHTHTHTHTMAESTWGKVVQFRVVCYCGSGSAEAATGRT